MKAHFNIGVVALLLLSMSSAKAEIQKTVSICKHGGGYGCSLNGFAPPQAYAPCTGGLVQHGYRYSCTAKPGYVFWLGKCNRYRKYIAMGTTGDGGIWCLRTE